MTSVNEKYLRMKGVITGKVVDWENGEKMEKLSEVGFSKFYSNSVGTKGRRKLN